MDYSSYIQEIKKLSDIEESRTNEFVLYFYKKLKDEKYCDLETKGEYSLMHY
jgi:hypothetical protein